MYSLPHFHNDLRMHSQLHNAYFSFLRCGIKALHTCTKCYLWIMVQNGPLSEHWSSLNSLSTASDNLTWFFYFYGIYFRNICGWHENHVIGGLMVGDAMTCKAHHRLKGLIVMCSVWNCILDCLELKAKEWQSCQMSSPLIWHKWHSIITCKYQFITWGCLDTHFTLEIH